MAIGREEVFWVADAVHERGVRVTNKSVKAALLAKYESSGNRNLVCKHVREWKKLNGIDSDSVKKPQPPTGAKARPGGGLATKKASGANSAAQPDTADDSIINKLPEPIRHAAITLISAILALIGMVRTQERDAATVLVDHATNKLQEELNEVRQQIIELEKENHRLTEDNTSLQVALTAKQETVSAEKLLAALTALLAGGANTPKTDAASPEQPTAGKMKPRPVIPKKAIKPGKNKKL